MSPVIHLPKRVVGSTRRSLAPKDIVVSQEDPPQGPGTDAHRSRATAGVIAGGVVGGAALVALVAVGVFFLRRRRRAYSQQNELPHSALWIYGLPPRPHDKRTPPYGAMAERPLNLRTSKTREASPHTLPAWPAPPNGHSNTGGISSREPAARGGSRSVGLDPPIEESPSLRPDVLTLRIELENLRRVVEGIQDERMAPPPEYVG